VFLVDTRQDDDIFDDLIRRLYEIKNWATAFARTHDVSSVLPMLGVVLAHSGGSGLAEPSAAIEASSSNPNLSLKYRQFVTGMCKALRLQEDCLVQQTCDFDDNKALLRNFLQLATAVLEKRKHFEAYPSSQVSSQKEKACCKGRCNTM